MQPYSYQPVPQQPPRYVYYYPGAPAMMGVPPQAQHPHAVQTVPTGTPSSSSSAVPSNSALYPTLAPSSSLAVTVPIQQSAPQQQQQQPFEFEMMPTVEQIQEEKEEEAEEKEESRPVQSTTTTTAPTFQPQAQPQFRPQPQAFMYPTTQYTMAPPPPQQPQQLPQPQPVIAQQPQEQAQDPQCRCHCRWHRHCRHSCRHGLAFKGFLFLQLALAAFFCLIAPHWITFSLALLFIFGIVSAFLENIPCLIVFSVGNVIPVWLGSMALFATLSQSLHGYHYALFELVIVAVICFLQWASLISGIHFTISVVKRKRAACRNANNTVPVPSQQPQHVVVNNVAPVNIPLPTIAPAQQSV